MLCKYHWIVLYTVHFTAFCLAGLFFPGHGVCRFLITLNYLGSLFLANRTNGRDFGTVLRLSSVCRRL